MIDLFFGAIMIALCLFWIFVLIPGFFKLRHNRQILNKAEEESRLARECIFKDDFVGASRHFKEADRLLDQEWKK